MAIDLTLLKKLREETSVSVSECRNALDAAGGDYKKALAVLKERAVEKAAKKADRATGEGLVESYIHGNRKMGAMVELLCETDFVAHTDEFKHLAHEIAMQIVAMNPETVEALMAQDYIKDGSQTIEQLIKQAIQKTGENVRINRFVRFAL